MQAKFTVADFKEDQVFSWMERQRSDHKNVQKFSLASIKVWWVLFSEQSTIRTLHPVLYLSFVSHPMGPRYPLRTKPLRFWERQAVECRKICSHSNTLSIYTQYTVYSLPSLVPATGDVLLENWTYVKCSYLPFVTQMDSTVTSHNKCHDIRLENLARSIFDHFHSLFSVFTHSQMTFGLSHCGLL